MAPAEQPAPLGQRVRPEQAERNRNALRSQRLIKEAYIRLAEARGEARITVADICREADINRTTFYAHFDSLDDMERFYMQDVLDGFGDWLAAEEVREGGIEAFFADPLPGLTLLGEYIESVLPLLNAQAKRHLRASESFGMGVRRALLAAAGELEGGRLMRFDFVAASLTNVYYTWSIGAYGEMTLAQLNETLAGYIRACA